MHRGQSKPLFARDTILAELAAESINLRKPSERVRVARVLESRSLLGDVLTRTRKRDVIKNRVIRNAHVQKIELSNLERPVYDRVNTILRKRALNSDSSQTLLTFRRNEIARSQSASALICTERATWSSGSSTRSSNVGASQRATISLPPTTLPS
jgi:hypothetical protein